MLGGTRIEPVPLPVKPRLGTNRPAHRFSRRGFACELRRGESRQPSRARSVSRINCAAASPAPVTAYAMPPLTEMICAVT